MWVITRDCIRHIKNWCSLEGTQLLPQSYGYTNKKICNEIKERPGQNVGHSPSCGQVSLLFVRPPIPPRKPHAFQSSRCRHKYVRTTTIAGHTSDRSSQSQCSKKEAKNTHLIFEESSAWARYKSILSLYTFHFHKFLTIDSTVLLQSMFLCSVLFSPCLTFT